MPGTAFHSKNIHRFKHGATVADAHSGGALSGVRCGLEPLIHGLTYDLCREDEPHHFAVTKLVARR